MRALLAKEPDCQIAGEAGDGLAALRPGEQSRPDVVIADITMPSLNGLDMTMKLTKQFPGIEVIVLSMYINEALVAEAPRNGAHGYAIKDSALTELVRALREVATSAFLARPSPRKSSVGTRQSPARTPVMATTNSPPASLILPIQ